MTIILTKGMNTGKFFEVLKVVDGIGVIVADNGVKVLIEDGDFERVCNKAKYKIKIFNLTTLRKNGFVFENGALMYKDDPKVSISGKWLNNIDAEMEVFAETDYDIVVKYLGVPYRLPKSARRIMYKKITK